MSARGVPVEMGPAERRAHARRWLLILAGYGCVLAFAFDLATSGWPGYWVSNALVAAMGVHAVLASPLPLSYYGITTRGAARSLLSALASSALLVGGGALLLRLAPPAAGSATAGFGAGAGMIAYLLVSVPVQELVFRGAFQGAVRFLLGGGRRASMLAVAASTLAFCAIHLPWGIGAAALVAVPGVIWGIQFERDRTLLGVVLSHVVVGCTFMGALPLWRLVAW